MLYKNIFLVVCDEDFFNEEFSRKKISDIINYFEIKKRLTNNDLLKNEPTKNIVEFHIIKKLNSFANCKKREFLYFYSKNVTKRLIENIKGIFSTCEYPVKFHLLIDNNKKIDQEIFESFDEIGYLENDKNSTN